MLKALLRNLSSVAVDNSLMKTLQLTVDPASLLTGDDCASSNNVRVAASILRNGGTVAFATETVYGLGANALDGNAVAAIFTAKQRPGWDPLIVHVAEDAMLWRVVSSIPDAAHAMMEHFWPGPLTLLMPRHADLPMTVTAGRERVGVRMPAHPVASALILTAGVPVAAPSANTFGHVSPTTAAHVAADLDGRIDAILDSGPSALGIESTVVDTCVDPCLLYRPGAVTLEQLRAVWPATEAYVPGVKAEFSASDLEAAGQASPGLGLRHYAPRAHLHLVEGLMEGEELEARVLAVLADAGKAGQRTGLMLPGGWARASGLADAASVVYHWGAWTDASELAQRLFAGMRALDAESVHLIVCPVPKVEGVGVAILDRLRKAARRA